MNNKLLKASMISLATVAVLSMTGCGSDDSSSNNSSSDNSGKAVDGYISGARVFLDVDGNGAFTTGEPNDYTDENGGYSLNATAKELAEAKANGGSIIVDDPKQKAIDVDSNKSFAGKLQAPFDGTNTDVKVTPLTGVVAGVYKSLYDNKGIDANSTVAYNTVAKLFVGGDNNGTQLMKDPVAVAQDTNDTTLLAKAMVLHHLAISLGKDDASKLIGHDDNDDDFVLNNDIFYEKNGTLTPNAKKVIAGSIATILNKTTNLLPNTNADVTKKLMYQAFNNMETAIKNAGGKDYNHSNIEGAAKILNKLDVASGNLPNTEKNLTLLKQLNSVARIVAIDKNSSRLSTLGNVVDTKIDTLADTLKTVMKDANITPQLSFGDLNVTTDAENGGGDINTTNEFPNISLTKKASYLCTLKLGKFLVDPFTKVEANLTINTDDGTNKYKLTIPVTMVSTNGIDLNITIPKDKNLSLTGSANEQYTVGDKDIVINPTADGYLNFNFDAIDAGLKAGTSHDDFNASDSNISLITNVAATYKTTVSFDVNDTKALKVTPIKGQIEFHN